jgi:hypothetical protein
MLRLFVYFLIWVAVGTLVYFKISPGALVAYGVLSMAGLLIWAATRKKPNA